MKIVNLRKILVIGTLIIICALGSCKWSQNSDNASNFVEAAFEMPF